MLAFKAARCAFAIWSLALSSDSWLPSNQYNPGILTESTMCHFLLLGNAKDNKHVSFQVVFCNLYSITGHYKVNNKS